MTWLWTTWTAEADEAAEKAGTVVDDVEDNTTTTDEASPLLLLLPRTTTTTTTQQQRSRDKKERGQRQQQQIEGEEKEEEEPQQRRHSTSSSGYHRSIMTRSFLLILTTVFAVAVFVAASMFSFSSGGGGGDSDSGRPLLLLRSINRAEMSHHHEHHHDHHDQHHEHHHHDHHHHDPSSQEQPSERDNILVVPLEGGGDGSDEDDEVQHHVRRSSSGTDDTSTTTKTTNNTSSSVGGGIPMKRCKFVVDIFVNKYFWVSEDLLQTQYQISTADPNVFYRATANIFWYDYVYNHWGDRIDFETLGIDALQYDGTPLQRRSTWTWVTGDQHLSNFGGWKNRHGDIVFGVNDFDEAAIYDFGVDVLRIAVSVCSHAHTNGLSYSEIKEVLRAFTDTYVQTIINYVGGDREQTWELTPETSTGTLRQFLKDVRDDKSTTHQLGKFTEVNDKTGQRQFVRNDNTRLVRVSPETEQKIREEFTEERYGATMMKMGWRVRSWNDEYFKILDIAARVGSGVGSYGVDRYYLLLKGTDESLDDWVDGNSVILDIKYEPPGAVAQVLSTEDTAWYDVLFQNDAERAVMAQRRLTSYTDPFTGWVIIDDKPFVVRQRSPWKSAPDLNAMTDPNEFIDFMEQVAVSTATSHVRGTVSKSPAQFKHVLASALGHYRDRTLWGKAVEQVAMDYREQVLLDFQCFKDYVDKLYPP